MKRYNNLYEKICDIENLRMAHKMARKGKNWYEEVKMVDANPDKYLYKLQEDLINKTYKTSSYETFTKVDKGKIREISKLPYYPDRICQWAIMLQIEPIIIGSLIYDTYASLPKRGIHIALDRVKSAIHNVKETQYCFKFDIKKYFPNIDHDILKVLIRKKIKDKDLLWLLDEIIDSCENGIPIGNYLSQYFANFYLSYFDHWMKEEMKCNYYFRYMDDVVVLSDTKKHLHKLKEKVEEYLSTNLKLRLKENWQIFPTFTRGIDFVGYRIFKDYVLLRKSTVRNIKYKIKKFKKRKPKDYDLNFIMSYMGWLEYCDSYNFKKKYMFPSIWLLYYEGLL